MSKKGTKAKRALTVTMSAALLISLSACSGATNNYGKLDEAGIYAKAGDYQVTNGELWDELKWSAQSLLSESINNVVLNEQITNVSSALEKNFADLTDLEKTNLSVEDEEGFKALKDKYKERIIDYVVQDVFAFTYSTEHYWSNVEKLDDKDAETLILKYADNVYLNYQKKNVKDNLTFKDALQDAYDAGAEDHKDVFYDVALALKQKYYPLLAKELLAYKTLKEDVDEAFEEDDDAEDSKIGYYEGTSYVSKFKSTYTNKYDLNLLMVRFADSAEYNNVLRAFGVKVYNKRFYFIRDNAESGYEDYLSGDSRTIMSKYNEMYDDFSTSHLTKEYGAYELSGEEVLELFIQIYNYSYSGYRTPLTSTVITKDTVLYVDNNGNEVKADYSKLSLNNLRNVTYRITDLYSSNAMDKYEANVTSLKEHNIDEITYYSDDLKEDFSDSFKLYMYETLKLTDDNGNVDMHSRYTTTTQSASDGYYAVYKLDDLYDVCEGVAIEEKLKKYQDFYKPSLSNYEILTYIQDEEKAPGLFDTILDLLIQEGITENYISESLTTAKEDVKVSIFNEAVEIGYKVANSGYSNSIFSAPNKNVLATIKYNDVTWNLNIVADGEDVDAYKEPGTNAAYGVYDTLEKTSGSSTAVSLLSRKMILDSDAYKKALDDKEKREAYETYLNNILIYFSNDYYSSSGYPASIGKYNYLMLSYHTADVKSIINESYLLSYASSQLLTNYASEDLAKFFKKYADLAYDKYFSIGDTRVVVYFDRDDDDEPDDLDFEDPENWVNETVTFDGNEVTRAYVARQLVLDIYNELAASTDAHTSKVSSIVTEINGSSKAIYDENPIITENKWAKYRYLGFKVKETTDNVTNSTTNIDFDLKQRLYDYAKGSSENGQTYQYFVNDTVPTAYIELLTQDALNDNATTIVATEEGFNLIVVTSGTAKSSAKWAKEDYENTELLENITFKYNDEYVTVKDIYNDDDKITINQILAYVLDLRVNGSSTIMPDALSTAISAYLSPVYERFTSDATQTIVLLNYIKSVSKAQGDIYNAISYTNTAYNGANGVFAEFVRINQDIADSYAAYVNDTTGTSKTFENWWDELYEQISSFINKEAK